jgi:protein-tyrosine-phosphatase
MVEFKRSAGGAFVLMEINPRLWGSLALSIAAGVNFPLGLWRIANNEPLPPQPVYRRGVCARRLGADLRWLAANLTADRDNSLLLLRPRLTSYLEIARIFSGRDSWDHFQWSDPEPFLRDLTSSLGPFWHALRVAWRKGWMTLGSSFLRGRTARRIRSVALRRPPNILFVCHGNICRSSFAQLAAQMRLPGFAVHSAGLDRRSGRGTPPLVVAEAAALGFDLSVWQSNTLRTQHVANADMIFVMEPRHYDELLARHPETRGRIALLGLFAAPPSLTITDPDRKDAATASSVLRQILSAIEGLGAAVGHTAPPSEQASAAGAFRSRSGG